MQLGYKWVVLLSWAHPWGVYQKLRGPCNYDEHQDIRLDSLQLFQTYLANLLNNSNELAWWSIHVLYKYMNSVETSIGQFLPMAGLLGIPIVNPRYWVELIMNQSILINDIPICFMVKNIP